MKGFKVEMEHKALFNLINKRCNNCVTAKEFYGNIAKAHIKENKNYYTILKRSGL